VVDTGGLRLLVLFREQFSTITRVRADGGYAGRLVTFARKVLDMTVQIVKRTDDLTGFQVLARRWVVVEQFQTTLLRYLARRCYRRACVGPRRRCAFSHVRSGSRIDCKAAPAGQRCRAPSLGPVGRDGVIAADPDAVRSAGTVPTNAGQVLPSSLSFIASAEASRRAITH